MRVSFRSTESETDLKRLMYTFLLASAALMLCRDAASLVISDDASSLRVNHRLAQNR